MKLDPLSAERCTAIVNELSATIGLKGPPEKIDWTKLRLIFAEILKQLVPIIMPLIIGLLEKDNSK